MFKIQYNQRGFAAFLIAILVMVVMIGAAISIGLLTVGEQKIAKNIVQSSQAYYVAEAGIEDSLYRIIKGKPYTATNEIVASGTEMTATTTIGITTKGDSKIIQSTGEAFPSVRSLEVELGPETSIITFHYGAQVDKGGLEVGANATVEGNVYSNGNIIGQGKGSGSKIVGDAWVAGGIAPDPDQQCTTSNADFVFGFPNQLDVAQSFKPSQTNVLRKISVYIRKAGSPPDRTIRIITDKAGIPDKNGTIATGILVASRVGTNYDWIDVSLQSPVNLTANQIYWLMIENSTFPLDSDNYYIWGRDENGSYLRGEGKWSSDWDAPNPIWYSITGDLNFKTWMGGEATSITKGWTTKNTHANTITQSWVDGEAYYQVIDDKTEVGPGGAHCPDTNIYCHPGSPDPPNEDLPISYAQIQDLEKAACCDNGSGCQAQCVTTTDNYVPPDGSSLGPMKIIGNLTISGTPGTTTQVTITGPVWVTGKILIDNNVIIKLKDGLSVGYPVITDTGDPDTPINYIQMEFSNNVITKDSSGGGWLLFVAANKHQYNDSAHPVVYLHNNINKDEPKGQSIVFSLQGFIRVEQNVKFKEVTGYGIYLANNSVIYYETGLINAGFSAGPGGGWNVNSWKEIE